MANSIYEATGDGSTTDFTIPYTYLEADDVTAFVGGVSTSFTFTSNNVVTFASAPANGASVRILRNTDLDALNVTYSDGGALTAEQLNTSNKQLLFGVQEAIDTANEAMAVDADGVFNAQKSSTNRRIKNVADPTSAQDAATKNYVDTGATSQLVQATQQATNAALSATASASSAAASSTSAAASLVSENASASSASTATTQAALSTTQANNSASSAAAALVSQNAASASASTAATQAGLATSNGAAQVALATTQAGNASTSATLSGNYANKTDGAVAGSEYSSKAWALGGTGVTDTAGSGGAKEWATDTTNQVDGTEYSAKEYAIGTQSGNTNGSAKQWAIGGGNSFSTNTAVSGGVYSAKYYAELAAASVDNFQDIYLGAFSSDPTQDGDGDALTAGDLYFSTSSSVLRVFNGSAWNDAVTDTTGFASNGFSIAMSIAL